MRCVPPGQMGGSHEAEAVAVRLARDHPADADGAYEEENIDGSPEKCGGRIEPQQGRQQQEPCAVCEQ